MNAFDELREAIAEDFPHVNGLLVYQGDALLMEEYRNGTTAQTFHPAGCIFKCFVSAAVGTALKVGLLQSVDQPIADFFPYPAYRQRRCAQNHHRTCPDQDDGTCLAAARLTGDGGFG